MGKAVIFVRVSTEKQHLESQEAALKKCAISDDFKESDIIYIGKKESGYKLEEDEREGLEELNQLIKKGDIDTVYIWELSRLSRKPKILYSVRDKLYENKIQLKCLNPQFTLLNVERTKYDNTANIIFSLFGALAEQEVIEKKERFARGKKRLAAEGKYSGGAIPFGYKIDKERGNLIVINDEEADIIREIYNMYENGLSQVSIAKEFYAKNLKRYTISFVHQILTNKLLTGVKSKNKNASYERAYPQIITSEQFEKCRAIANKNNTTASKARNIYYADKLIKCPKCGGYFSSSGTRTLYRCYKAHYINKDVNGYDGITLCTNKTNISINIIDSILWHLAQFLETNYILTSAQDDIDNLDKRKNDLLVKLANIEPLLNEINLKRDKLREMYIDGLSKEIFNKRKAILDNEEKEIRKKEIEYNNEITHIEGIKENILSHYNFKNENEMTDIITNNICDILDEIEKVEDDKIRYDIIHKHIKEVIVEDCTIMHKFDCYKEEKESKARRISIETYIGGKFNYIFIPFDGKGGTIYVCNSEFEIINKANIEYLKRFIHRRKIEKREVEKKERKLAKTKKYEERRAKGILTIREAAEHSKINYATLWYAVKDKRLECQIINNVKYIKLEDLNEYANTKRKSPNT